MKTSSSSIGSPRSHSRRRVHRDLNTLAIIDVGHGNAAVAISGPRVVVIDAGPKNGLLDYLRQEEISEIDLVILSHTDQDHIAGLIGVLATGDITVDRVRVNSDALKDSALWADMLYELELRANSIDVAFSVSVSQTQEFSDEHLGIQVLAPSVELAGRGPGGATAQGKSITSHMMSAVLRLEREGNPIALLCGDLDSAGLELLLESAADARAPVLVFPHHGGNIGGGSAAQFAEELWRGRRAKSRHLLDRPRQAWHAQT